MKIVLFTSNSVRHRFVANTLAEHAGVDTLVISEVKESDTAVRDDVLLQEHFLSRHAAEQKLFSGHDFFRTATLPIAYKEVNAAFVFEAVKNFQPDMMFVFGASIIKEPLLSYLPAGRFINLHLGLSPYYRGSGTNFWPFVNGELECLGSTILHLDAGVDTGDIIAHVRPDIFVDDDVHTVGCRIIKDSAEVLRNIITLVKNGQQLNRVKQWSIDNARYYRKRDFTRETLQRYKNNLAAGMIADYLKRKKQNLKLVSLT